jgi:hypothetical protein
MAKFWVLTNRRKLDEFLRLGGDINDTAMIVGMVSGKPKYPKGHVGRRSREMGRQATRSIHPKELERRRVIRGMRGQLEGLDKQQRKATIKQMRAALKQSGMSSRGLGRKSAPATPVARVAGVLASERQYHLAAITGRRARFKTELDMLQRTLFGRGNTATVLTSIGRHIRLDLRKSFRATGHMDTGKLSRNIQYMIFSQSGKERAREIAREMRALAKAAKKGRGR